MRLDMSDVQRRESTTENLGSKLRSSMSGVGRLARRRERARGLLSRPIRSACAQLREVVQRSDESPDAGRLLRNTAHARIDARTTTLHASGTQRVRQAHGSTGYSRCMIRGHRAVKANGRAASSVLSALGRCVVLPFWPHARRSVSCSGGISVEIAEPSKLTRRNTEKNACLHCRRPTPVSPHHPS